MDIANYLGSVAGALTTIAFVPQLIQVVKTKSTKDISLLMFIIFTSGVTCWTIYGILIKEIPIIVANSIVFVLALVILGYKIKYK
jgi:MtN3 and saliva related transmembrane protein